MNQMIPTRRGLDRAIDLANRARRDVPAYAEFLDQHGVTCEVEGRDDFATLPATTKVEYLQRYSIPQLMWDCDVSAAGSWSATSGSTGNPTFFPRDDVALNDSTRFYGRILEENFGIGDQTTLVIVCFAMGTWIGGTYTYQTFLELRRHGRRISLTTTGIDVDAAVRNLTELGPHYEKVILAGYPPLIKDVLDRAGESALAQDLYLLLAGEAIGEGWRDHLLNRIGHPDRPERVCLMYGTAEAGVMGHETPATVRIRRAARPGTLLAWKLFGDKGTRLPTFVAVDPESRYVEVVEGFLLFTIDSTMPLIRYRINDRGGVFTADRLRAVLTVCGYPELAEDVDPAAVYVVLAGRTDVATTFYSSNIYVGHLAEAFDDSLVTARVTGRFVVDGTPDESHEPVLRIDVELSAGGSADDELAALLTSLCVESLTSNNDEYRTMRAAHGECTIPRIKLHPYGTGPFGAVSVKHNYVGGN
ncbi:MAG: hypothetical protein INR66_24890 [Gordonia polyisoprenivorans]|nr:hypothetical protein [Gordonia polyisoprenivorans]